MDYGSIAPEDIALCDLATGKWTGPRRPSGERAVHALAYSMFEDVNFVIHTHQTYASALGLCGYKPGCFTGEERQQLGGVTVAGYGLPGTKDAAKRDARGHVARGQNDFHGAPRRSDLRAQPRRSADTCAAARTALPPAAGRVY